MPENPESAGLPETERAKTIVRTSAIGIIANALLAALKAVIGIASNSIAITMDALNNISDAASSVITILGAKLAGREQDKKHPFGYGRVEYFSALVISALVLYTGITALVESAKKIVHPEIPDYSMISLMIVAVAVVVKILLGRYVKKMGEKTDSASLVNSGEDATLDSVISASTLVAAAIHLAFGVSLEAWLGAIIAGVIIKSGIGMLGEALSRILGERSDASLAREITKTVSGYPEVAGAYDLVLHDYGPGAHIGSIHIEVPGSTSADDLDMLSREITSEVRRKHGVILAAIGVYSTNGNDPEAVAARERINGIVMGIRHVMQMHGFHMNTAEKTMRFDIVISFDAKNRAAVCEEALARARQAFPDYEIQIAADLDFGGL